VSVKHSYLPRTLRNVAIILKWAEIIFLLLYLLAVFWFLYTGNCASASCRDMRLTRDTVILGIQVGLTFGGILSSLRIGIAYLVLDQDDDPETLFYLALVGMALTYTIIGVNIQELLGPGDVRATSPLLLAAIVSLLISVLLFFADKKTWDKSISFVRVRAIIGILHLLLLIINPVLGVVTTIVLYPLQTLMYDGPSKKRVRSKSVPKAN